METLLRINGPTAGWTTVLEQGLTSADPPTRLAALDAARLFGPRAESLFPVLRRMLRDPEQLVRNRAVQCLGNLGPAARPAVAEMLAAFPDEASSQRPPDFAASLSQLGPAILPELSGALAHAHPSIRLGAAAALRQMGPPAAGAAPALLPLLRDPVRPVRRETVLALMALRDFTPETVGALTSALGHPDWSTASTAATALGQLGPDAAAATPALLSMVRTNDRCRLEAVLALGQVRPVSTQIVAAVTACLEDRNLSVRRAALDALAEMGPAAAHAAPGLRAAAKTPFYLVSIKAARALWELTRDTNAVVEILEESLRNRDSLVSALEELGHLGAAGLRAAGSVRLWLDDRSPSIRLAAAGAIWRIQGDAGPVLVAAREPLRFGPAEARLQAATLARQLGPAARPLVPELIRCLRQEDALARREAADALAGIGAVALPELRAELALGDFRSAIPLARICWRINRETEGLVGILAGGLRHGDPEFRQLAILTLGEMGEPVVGTLTAALRDPLASVRAGAAAALGSIGPPARPGAAGLRQSQQDPNAIVRFEATRALRSIERDPL
jgi:HEAT repeat protein